jgi:hypothetical protein
MPRIFCVWDTTMGILRQLQASHSLSPHIDHVERSGVVSLVRLLTTEMTNILMQLGLDGALFSQVCQLANPTRGWLCTARLGPCARNGDGGSAEIESSMQTAIFLLIERWTPPACPLSGTGRSGSPSRRGTHRRQVEIRQSQYTGLYITQTRRAAGYPDTDQKPRSPHKFSKLLEACISRRPLPPFKQVWGDREGNHLRLSRVYFLFPLGLICGAGQLKHILLDKIAMEMFVGRIPKPSMDIA